MKVSNLQAFHVFFQIIVLDFWLHVMSRCSSLSYCFCLALSAYDDKVRLLN